MAALMKRVNEVPEAPSSRSDLTIPPELDALVLECLEKDPTSRPRSAEELSAKLRLIPFDRPWGKVDARQWWDAHDPQNQ